MQRVSSPFETDLFKDIISHLQEIFDIDYKKEKVSFRIIADHLRASVFLITDGVTPSNEGRGYILRRLIRRAERIGKTLGIEKPFLYKVVPTVVNTLKKVYPELKEREEYTFRLIQTEEEKFLQTLSKGVEIIEEIIRELKIKNEKILKGEDAFKLYDTYGFPLDITKEIAASAGILVEEEEFDRILREHQEKARIARGDVSFSTFELYNKIKEKIPPVSFVGYEKTEVEGKITNIIVNEKEKEIAEEGEEVEIILDKTPFYPEKGGQVGDRGEILKADGIIEVFDTQSPVEGVIVHRGKVKKGFFKIDENVFAKVDKERREKISQHHTATHLLHSALRKILGTQVKQAGSLVDEERLRFDFTHYKALSEEELERVEEEVFKNISKNLEVEKYYTTFEEAKKQEAIALFEEKYEDVVRVIKIGDVSIELCGGTHLDRTGNIGIFKIVKEESIGSGLRRIEAKVGISAYQHIKEEEKILKKISSLFKIPISEIENRVEKILLDFKEKEREISILKNKLRKQNIENIIKNAKEIDGIKFITERIETSEMKEMREFADEIIGKIERGVVIISALGEKKVNFIGLATKNLVEEGINMAEILKEIAKITNGSGGGRADYAQGGGKNPERLEEALKYAEEILRKKIR
jgi:alanyl-tRNA synthetase